MDINSVNLKQNRIANQPAPASPKTVGTDKPDDRKGIDSSAAGDSVELSSESLRLASSTGVKDMNNQIPDRQQARKLVDQLVTSIRSQPNQAQNAFGTMSQAQVGALLA